MKHHSNFRSGFSMEMFTNPSYGGYHKMTMETPGFTPPTLLKKHVWKLRPIAGSHPHCYAPYVLWSLNRKRHRSDFLRSLEPLPFHISFLLLLPCGFVVSCWYSMISHMLQNKVEPPPILGKMVVLLPWHMPCNMDMFSFTAEPKPGA